MAHTWFRDQMTGRFGSGMQIQESRSWDRFEGTRTGFGLWLILPMGRRSSLVLRTEASAFGMRALVRRSPAHSEAMWTGCDRCRSLPTENGSYPALTTKRFASGMRSLAQTSWSHSEGIV